MTAAMTGACNNRICTKIVHREKEYSSQRKRSFVAAPCHGCHHVMVLSLYMHVNCGSIFFSSSTYCKRHRPTQNTVISSESTQCPTCPICLCDVDFTDALSILKSPCCKNAWFHRSCIQVRYSNPFLKGGLRQEVFVRRGVDEQEFLGMGEVGGGQTVDRDPCHPRSKL